MIAIVITAFNLERYIKEAVSSVLGNDNAIVIVVDDGSVDNTFSILTSLRGIENLHVLRQENKGVSEARNTGLRYAKNKGADYVMFIDGDDLLSINWYEKVSKEIAAYSPDILIVGQVEFDKEKDRPYYSCFKETENISKIEAAKLFFHSSKYKKETLLSSKGMANKVVSMRTIENLLFKKELRLGEDQIFYLNAWRSAERICVLPQPIYRYRQRKTSLTHGTEHKEDLLLGYREYKKIYEKVRIEYSKEVSGYFLLELSRWFKKILRSSRCLEQSFWNGERRYFIREIIERGYYSKNYLFLKLLLQFGAPNVIFNRIFIKNKYKNNIQQDSEKLFD